MKVIMCPSEHPYLKRLTKSLQGLGADIVGIPNFSISTGMFDIAKFCMEAKDADIIHFHWIPFNWYWMQPIILQLCKQFNLRIVWTVHNLIPHTPRFNPKKDFNSFKKMMDFSDGLIFHSKRTQEEFHKKYGKYEGIESIIPHGNFNDFAPKELLDNPYKFKPKCREKLHISNDKTVILMFPPNRWTKGIKNFVNILNSLNSTYIGILAGQCKDKAIKDYLAGIRRKYPSKFIIRPEHVSKKEMDIYFGASDIFLMPYTRISTSGSIMTAMSYLLPIFSTDLGNLDMLVENGVNGFLCNSNEEFVKRINSLDKTIIMEMGKKSRIIASRYKWSDIASDTLKLYEKAVEK